MQRREYSPTERTFQEQSSFIREYFPGGPDDIQRIIESALDGFEVLESRDKRGNLEGLATYTIGSEKDGQKYCAFGVIVVDEEFRGEGLSDELFKKLVETARKADCDHISAKAETSFGKSFLERVGFKETNDSANHQDYYRFELYTKD